MNKLHGYNSTGTETYGAEYRRKNPKDTPDAFVPGQRIAFGAGRLTTGTRVNVLGLTVVVMAGRDQVAVIVDTVDIPASKVEEVFPLERLLRWRGLYWRVEAVHGTFIQLTLFGTKKVKPGWYLHTKGKVLYTRPARKNVE